MATVPSTWPPTRTLLLLLVAGVSVAALSAGGPVIGSVVEVPANVAATDGPTASGSAAGHPGTLGPPDYPDEPIPPEQIPGREEVQNTSQYPHSAVGWAGASGVLVSEYHVLTAAHIYTDENGDLDVDTDDATFVPGLRNVPDGPTEAPYGQANVTDIRLHSEWDGEPPEDDLAVLTLDRPVGIHAGSMALRGGWGHRPLQTEVQQAGYVHNVTGYRQLASRPTTRALETAGTPDYHHYCGPLSNGDSGSPVWIDVGDEAVLLSVNSAFAQHDCTGPRGTNGAVGVSMTEERVALVERWMGETERPPSRPDVVVSSPHSSPGWIDGEASLPERAPRSNDTPISVGVQLYNNGPAGAGSGAAHGGGASEPVPVAFTATVRQSTDDGTEILARYEDVCSTTATVPAYDTGRAACSGTIDPELLAAGDSLDVYATVDPDGTVDQYRTTPLEGRDGPQPVGRIQLGTA